MVVEQFDLSDPKTRYLNRELSSIAFNERVLHYAYDTTIPLLERVRFLAISSSNLDEFTMVRVAGLKDQARNYINNISPDGRSVPEQLRVLSGTVRTILQQQQQCWLQLKEELTAEQIFVLHPSDLSAEQNAALEMLFLSDIFPALSPIAIDPAHPFPFLPNLGLVQLYTLKNQKTGTLLNSVLPLPNKLHRFYRIKHAGAGIHMVPLEDITLRFAYLLFPGFSVEESTLFRIVRDSDLEVSEDAEDLVQNYEHAVKRRRRGRIIRVKALKPVSIALTNFFMDHVETDIQQVHEMEGMLGLCDLAELCKIEREDLKFPPYTARFPERISEHSGDCFAAIAAKDIVVHHPYESFDVVVQFLNQAAQDPDVVSIKQTLYRTSNDSPIVNALIRAAEEGKSVTALVELRARFDEEANIRWAKNLERAGVQVVYGFVHLKTHAKISLVVRRERESLVSYVHFGTGNYHPITARIYTDLSYFTCNNVLTTEAHYLFNYITGYGTPSHYHHLIPAPDHMRTSVLQMIHQEAEYARAGKPAAIWAKMNALVDQEIIEALYAASQAGVHIQLVVRGICCLRPQVKGLSDHIHVKSIVGRFLEHARIYCFGGGHGLPSPNAHVYIGSADWMPRNLNKRVEVMIPITNPTVHAQILDQIMMANLNDEANSWLLRSDGTYHRGNREGFSAHRYFMENPSLSGRGSNLSVRRRKKRKPKSE
ncbi:MAG: RNA degradosome polyphosphate kinase [Alphaproteobacteria bacterium]|nr:MAG: RNA degradosome polyphosphate kinase [Alphaproteobacteria bacterium]